MNVKLAAAYIS